jgi:hypothetical protein
MRLTLIELTTYILYMYSLYDVYIDNAVYNISNFEEKKDIQ